MKIRKETIKQQSVSFLTPNIDERRNSDGLANEQRFQSLLGNFAILMLVCTLLACAVTVNAESWQKTSEITAVAEQYAKTRFGNADDRVTPIAGHLDSRLRLPQCSQPLEPFLRPGTKINSRTIIGVRCNGVRPWKVYVPVNIVVMQSVYVAKRTLPRGHLVSVADVVLEEHDVARLRNGYFASFDELAGQKLKQQIIGGRVLTPAVLAADVMVRRGQTVTLVVRNTQMNIAMSGKALTDGALNQRIRVKNVNSERIVEGLVRSPETVEILVQN